MQVRNESVGDFLKLLKEWPKICASFGLIKSENTNEKIDAMVVEDDEDDDGAENDSGKDDNKDDGEIFEVEKVIGICYGDPTKSGTPELHFKVFVLEMK